LDPQIGQKHPTQAKEDESKEDTRPPFRGKRAYHHVSSRDETGLLGYSAEHKNYWREGNQYTSGFVDHFTSATFFSGTP
jgi:hypothetical protein